ncbi:stAR-related lipid transfer protein 7, mitochondrial-like isoform X2 [Liolophura sinensis]
MSGSTRILQGRNVFTRAETIKLFKTARDALFLRLSNRSGRWGPAVVGSGVQSIASQFGRALNERLVILSELFARQCNAIAAQRARRTAQVMNLYSRIYSEHSLRFVLERLLRSNFFKRAKGRPIYLLFGSTVFNWEKEKINDEELTSCVEDMDHIMKLQSDSVYDRHYMDMWEIVINRPHLKAWRQPVNGTHLYQYKVYGSFDDISPKAFFSVQVDLGYRKEWDKLVIKLDCIDRDEESGSELVHWVTHFPYPMYSRDYVFVRRYQVDRENNVMVLTSRAVEHPSLPVSESYVRVSTYNSKMVIRPHSSIEENGFDYVLTYYDDPQAAFPTFAYKWMASTG